MRLLIGSLSFTSEGYSRAKLISTSKFGKPLKVATTHVLSIISLSVTVNSNPNSIHEFHEKLAISVQALDAVKLTEINGCVRRSLKNCQV